MTTMQNTQGNHVVQHLQTRDKLDEFQKTMPPTFLHSVEPMDVDDLIRTIEKKLQVVQCSNRKRVLVTSHQLERSAFEWWDAYVNAHEEPQNIGCQEFRNAFHTHHVP
jgi:TPP-dependent indolepyruvate ferredoxin oxidoreductase alpha subunit